MDDKPKPRSGPTTFKKGVSGNPGGRSPRIGPNGETAAQLARMHTADAFRWLVEVGENPRSPAMARVAAAVAIHDRGWGKPTEYVDLDATVKSNMPIINLTLTRLVADDAA